MAAKRILQCLEASKQPLRALDIARTVGGGLSKAAVNAILYELQKQGQVQRTEENPPLWSSVTSPAFTNPRIETLPTFNELLEFLQQQYPRGVSTTELVKTTNSSNSKDVNRMLYGLEKEGKIARVQVSPPVWKALSQSTPTTKASESTLKHPANKTTTTREPSPPPTRQQVQPVVAPAQRHRSPTATKQQPPKSTLEDSKRRCEKIHSKSPSQTDQVWAKMCADAVWHHFRSLQSTSTKTTAQKEVVAGFLLKTKDQTTPRVVALGSGSKCLGGDQFSLEGRVVHDSHAEIVARRSLVRWLYYQLETAGNSESMATRSNSSGDDDDECPFQLRPFQLWLYISQTPCGDSAIFSRSDPQPACAPSWTTPRHGGFRTKLEAGQGAVPAKRSLQTMDGVRLGERSMSNSCSDKVALWNVVGVQGSLLSRLIAPVYLNGIVIGDVFSYGHACRALCCRSQVALDTNTTTPDNTVRDPYKPNHPCILHHPTNNRRTELTAKVSESSLNWAEQDGTNIEQICCRTGLLDNGDSSRISKSAIFSSFCRLVPSSASQTYAENKALATGYMGAKHTWLQAMEECYDGLWTRKSGEFSEFNSISK